MSGRGFGVYVHWPYCERVCPYCDFNVVRARGREDEAAALARAILADLVGWRALTGPRKLDSIFFGGGTPSLMAAETAAAVIERSRALWPPRGEPEITLEANPSDIAAFEGFATAGVNRLSLGVQALNDADLARLGRNHDAAAARRAIAAATAVFPRVSLDLIYALPGQRPEAWRATLEAAADLGAEHISPYQLTIEPGTAFARAAGRGTLVAPDPELAAELYETTQGTLGDLGFEAYEVSNHARSPAARARHNLIAWRGGDYLGVGPGAHGRLTLGDRRYASEAPRGVGEYVRRLRAHGTGAALTPLSDREAALERLLMGLRTSEGVAWSDLEPLAAPDERVARLDGLVRSEAGRLTATARGRLVLDRVIAELADAA